mmetsp:Transcript_3955/g.11491  ORF Transcript_3955/g.11491 Transcript_3955/m.11491 type:complete len:269 (-) Transcript_3955:984-1790(-)
MDVVREDGGVRCHADERPVVLAKVDVDDAHVKARVGHVEVQVGRTNQTREGVVEPEPDGDRQVGPGEELPAHVHRAHVLDGLRAEAPPRPLQNRVALIAVERELEERLRGRRVGPASHGDVLDFHVHRRRLARDVVPEDAVGVGDIVRPHGPGYDEVGPCAGLGGDALRRHDGLLRVHVLPVFRDGVDLREAALIVEDLRAEDAHVLDGDLARVEDAGRAHEPGLAVEVLRGQEIEVEDLHLLEPRHALDRHLHIQVHVALRGHVPPG